MPRRVAIIGAGPAGLAAAAMLLQPDEALFDEVHVRSHASNTPAHPYTTPLHATLTSNKPPTLVTRKYRGTHSRTTHSPPLLPAPAHSCPRASFLAPQVFDGGDEAGATRFDPDRSYSICLSGHGTAALSEACG